MYNLIISIPLTTSIIILILGRKIGIKGIKIITIINMITILIINIIYLFNTFISNSIIHSDLKDQGIILDKKSRKGLELGEWINIGQIEEKYKIEISKITIIMTTLIIIISFSVILYSFWYLKIDTHINRFISY